MAESQLSHPLTSSRTRLPSSSVVERIIVATMANQGGGVDVSRWWSVSALEPLSRGGPALSPVVGCILPMFSAFQSLVTHEFGQRRWANKKGPQSIESMRKMPREEDQMLTAVSLQRLQRDRRDRLPRAGKGETHQVSRRSHKVALSSHQASASKAGEYRTYLCQRADTCC